MSLLLPGGRHLPQQGLTDIKFVVLWAIISDLHQDYPQTFILAESKRKRGKKMADWVYLRSVTLSIHRSPWKDWLTERERCRPLIVVNATTHWSTVWFWLLIKKPSRKQGWSVDLYEVFSITALIWKWILYIKCTDYLLQEFTGTSHRSKDN